MAAITAFKTTIYLMTAYKIPTDVIEALREGQPLADEKLQALRHYTQMLIDKRGDIGDAEPQNFPDAGYTKRRSLEVLFGPASKLISIFHYCPCAHQTRRWGSAFRLGAPEEPQVS